MSAIRRDDKDTPRTGGEQVAVFVDLHAVRNAGFSFRPESRIEQSFTVRDGAIRFHIIDHPDGIAGVGVADIELFLVRRERDAIGGFDILCEEREFAVFSEFVERPGTLTLCPDHRRTWANRTAGQ